MSRPSDGMYESFIARDLSSYQNVVVVDKHILPITLLYEMLRCECQTGYIDPMDIYAWCAGMFEEEQAALAFLVPMETLLTLALTQL